MKILAFKLLSLVFIVTLSFFRLQNGKIKEVTLKSYYNMSGCGNLAFAAGFLFGLNEVDSTFIGVIKCPGDFPLGFWKIGEKYKVQITNKAISDSLKTYSILNPYLRKGYPIYLITDIEQIKSIVPYHKVSASSSSNYSRGKQ